MQFLGNLLPTGIAVDSLGYTKASKFNHQFQNSCCNYLSICKLDHHAGGKVVFSTIDSSVTTKTLALKANAM